MKRKNMLVLLTIFALMVACLFGCKTNDSNPPIEDVEGSLVDDMDADIGGGAAIDFDDLLNVGSDDDAQNDNDTSEDAAPDKDQSSESKPEENKPEESKPEENKPADSDPEENQPETNDPVEDAPDTNQPENDEPAQGEDPAHSGVIENDETDVDVPF